MIFSENWVLYQNPKTGSTSIHETLGGAGYKKDYGHAISSHPPRGIRIWTTVRNPFDRLCSGYFFWGADQKGLTFYQWLTGKPRPVTSGVDFLRTPQFYWYQQAYAENRIIRFEQFEEDFEEFKRRELVECGPLQFHNKTDSREDRHYRDVIDTKSKEIIKDRFYTDFEMLGYRW